MNRPSKNMDQRPFILIVDDIPRNLQILGNFLDADGYAFTPAISGAQALKIVEKRRPDLILLDIMMPEMDGYDVCKRLKSSPMTKDIPIIFLTAKTDTDDIVKGFDLGGVDYITKPFNAVELLARVKTHLKLMKISNERKELLHVLCHDLANMFHPIISGLSIIKADERFERLKGAMLTAARNGVEIIDLVRKMRSLEDGKEILDMEPVKLKNAVYESLSILASMFKEKDIEVITEIDEDLTVHVESTSFVNSVLNNLFTNALKFSFQGSIITVNAASSDGIVTVFIKDFGLGMPEQLQKNLFDMNTSTTRKGTKGEWGTGFGMPLVKKFVNAYDGSLDVFSKEKIDDSDEHGTEIKLTLKKGTAV